MQSHKATSADPHAHATALHTGATPDVVDEIPDAQQYAPSLPRRPRATPHGATRFRGVYNCKRRPRRESPVSRRIRTRTHIKDIRRLLSPLLHACARCRVHADEGHASSTPAACAGHEDTHIVRCNAKQVLSDKQLIAQRRKRKQ